MEQASFARPCTPGDCNVVGVVSFFFRNCCFTWKNISSEFATFHLVFADRRATARTTTVEPCSIQTKKNSSGSIDSGGHTHYIIGHKPLCVFVFYHPWPSPWLAAPNLPASVDAFLGYHQTPSVSPSNKYVFHVDIFHCDFRALLDFLYSTLRC